MIRKVPRWADADPEEAARASKTKTLVSYNKCLVQFIHDLLTSKEIQENIQRAKNAPEEDQKNCGMHGTNKSVQKLDPTTSAISFRPRPKFDLDTITQLVHKQIQTRPRKSAKCMPQVEPSMRPEVNQTCSEMDQDDQREAQDGPRWSKISLPI